MLFLYGYVWPVIYMALNAKMFYGGFMPQIFNDHQGVHATSNLRPRVDIFVMAVSFFMLFQTFNIGPECHYPPKHILWVNMPFSNLPTWDLK